MKNESLNENEKKVLGKLAYDFSEDEWRAWYFKGLVRETGLELKQVRRACRSLAKKGYAKYERGLFNEDGEVAGSGYRATQEGYNLFTWCQHEYCGEEATHISDDGYYHACEKHAHLDDMRPIKPTLV